MVKQREQYRIEELNKLRKKINYHNNKLEKEIDGLRRKKIPLHHIFNEIHCIENGFQYTTKKSEVYLNRLKQLKEKNND